MSQFLHIEGLGHQFGDIIALEEIHLSLEAKSCLAIIGPNGAGKSTLFNCISGVYTPPRGTLTFMGQSLMGKSVAQIARLGISRTFQQPKLFESLRVYQHLSLAQLQFSRLRRTPLLLDQILDDCGLAVIKDQKPKNLSFGQQKTLEIARCLAAKAKLLMLDEPAAGLSEREKGSLIRLLKSLQVKYQFSILLVEHQLSLVEQLAEQVLLIDRGRSLIQASWEEVKRSTEWQKYQR